MEVIDPAITIKVIGFLKDGLKSHILKKIKDTIFGQKNITQQIYFKLYEFKYIYKLFYYPFYHIINKRKINNLLLNIPNNRNRQNGIFVPMRCFHSRCRAINRIGPHNIDIISVLVGLLLGDGHASNRTGEGIRFSIKQNIKHKEYLFSLYEFFLTRGYCSNLEPRQYKRRIKGIDKIYYGYEFNTYTFRSFLWLYKSFYKKGKKIIPLNITNYITPLTLAVWISDDGTWTVNGVRIATNSFTLMELEYLKILLFTKFNLNCTIQKIYLENKYSIYIKKDSINKLRELVLPHLHKSMYYKLGII